jgi:CubicO group peptidase (beta-lactamase class C family)
MKVMKKSILGLVIMAVAHTAVAAPLERALARCVAAQSKQAAFSGIIVASKAGARFFHQSGFADAESKRVLGRDTPFRLASVGKLFTQVALGKLVQSGKLRLDDSVRDYLPELPESFAPISIAHLLHHRSGVAEMTRPEFADAPTLAGAKNARDLVPLLAGKPLSFKPGSRERYSNGGYLLLGAVIESVSGQSYRDYVTQKIFEPLGMKDSSFEPGPQSATPLTRMAGPGQPPAERPMPRMEFPEFKATSAGDALSSAADLERFAEALVNDQFLTQAVKKALFTRQLEPWRIGQAGGSVGSNTGLWAYPDEKAWLVVLTNFDPPAGELMGQTLQDVLRGQPCKTVLPTASRMR